MNVSVASPVCHNVSSAPGEVIELGDVTLAPGYVDVHNHGGGGAAFAQDPATAAALHRSHGTTSVVASLVTQSLDELDGLIVSTPERQA